jgi:hypothetical protein
MVQRVKMARLGGDEMDCIYALVIVCFVQTVATEF